MRFTLKTLFAVVSVAALICCVFFALPGWLSLTVLGLLAFLAPPVFIAGIVYGRGYGRAFCIGCVCAGGGLPLIYEYAGMCGLEIVLVDFEATDNDRVLSMQIAFGVVSVLIGLSGLAAVGVRWLCLRQNRTASESQSLSPAEYSFLHGRVSTIQMESTPVEPEPRGNASLP